MHVYHHHMGPDHIRVEIGRTSSYRIETLDAAAELVRLEAQVRLVAQMELPALRNAGLKPGMHLMDVGCGPGFFAELAVRELVPQGRVTGVDVDGALLAPARERAVQGGLPIEYVLASGVAIPLDDDSCDFAYARFLFQHLDRPLEVLAEMRRVVRPGGIVMVMDSDDAGLLVHPEPPGFAALIAAAAASQRDRGGDRTIGRRLRGLFHDAGLEEVHASARLLTTDHVPPQAFIHITTAFKAELLDPKYIDPADASATLAQLREAADRPDFFGHALGYGAWGRVPQ
jgi:SAM-dependent methyltransferase